MALFVCPEEHSNTLLGYINQEYQNTTSSILSQQQVRTKKKKKKIISERTLHTRALSNNKIFCFSRLKEIWFYFFLFLKVVLKLRMLAKSIGIDINDKSAQLIVKVWWILFLEKNCGENITGNFSCYIFV